MNTNEIPVRIMCYSNQSLSAIHHGLRASRRRLVVGIVAYRTLSNNQGYYEPASLESDGVKKSVTVSVLAREIVSIEEGIPVKNATGKTYHNVYTALIQTHLPKLDKLGAINYEENRKLVTPDQNLIAMSIVAAVTSPISQTLFYSAISEHDLGGTGSVHDSTGD